MEGKKNSFPACHASMHPLFHIQINQSSTDVIVLCSEIWQIGFKIGLAIENEGSWWKGVILTGG